MFEERKKWNGMTGNRGEKLKEYDGTQTEEEVL